MPSSYYTDENNRCSSGHSSSQNKVLTSQCAFCNVDITIDYEMHPIFFFENDLPENYLELPIRCTCSNTGKSHEVNAPSFREYIHPLSGFYCSCRKSERCINQVKNKRKVDDNDCQICIKRIAINTMNYIIDDFVNDIIMDDEDIGIGTNDNNDNYNDNYNDNDINLCMDRLSPFCIGTTENKTVDIFSQSPVIIGLIGHDRTRDDRTIFAKVIDSIARRVRQSNEDKVIVSVSALRYGAHDDAQFSMLVAKRNSVNEFLLLLAIIRGIPVVSYDWVNACSRETSWLSPTSYELVHKANTKLSGKLFAGINFSIASINSSFLSEKQLRILIDEAGGQVVPSDSYFDYLIVGDEEVECKENGSSCKIVTCSLLGRCILNWELALGSVVQPRVS